MQAIAQRMLHSHGGRVAEGIASLIGKATKGAAAVGKNSVRAVGSAALLTLDVTKRQVAYHDTLQDLAAMATNRDMVVKALASYHGPDLAHLPNSIPAMTDALQKGALFCLNVAPVRPQAGLFGDDDPGLLSDSEAEEWSNTVHVAMDPASIFEVMKRGQLTPQVLRQPKLQPHTSSTTCGSR